MVLKVFYQFVCKFVFMVADVVSDFESEVSEVLSGREEVLLGYIFGSYVEGREHEDSDLDIGILTNDSLGNKELFQLSELLEDSLGVEPDVRVLNRADPRFVYNVLDKGRLAYKKNESIRIDFESAAMREYLDMKPFIDRHDKAVRERLTG